MLAIFQIFSSQHLSKHDQFEFRVGIVEWCSNIHVEHFYTTESGEYAGKYIYN